MSGRDSGASEKARRNEVLNKVPTTRFENAYRIRRKVWPDGFTQLDNRVLDDRTRRYLRELMAMGKIEMRKNGREELFRRLTGSERDAEGAGLDMLYHRADRADGVMALDAEEVKG